MYADLIRNYKKQRIKSLYDNNVKKNPKEFDQLTEEYYQNMQDKELNPKLCNYVWKVLVAYSRGYGFNKSHTLAYSLIALQEMNLAYKYPIMFWNCACLISDAGGNEFEDEFESENEDNEITENFVNMVEEFNSSDEPEDDEDEEDEEEVTTPNAKKVKKVKSVNYGKITTAIGKIAATGVKISPPDINQSAFTFSPDIENNTIRYGLSGIVRIGAELVKDIMNNRPYTSIHDFLQKVKINKPQMINLIKAGAFDTFGDRIKIMHDYVDEISDTKKRITLQNMKMLIDFNLIPDEYDLQRRVYNFNKYIKKLSLDATYYGLDAIGFEFYNKYFDIDKLTQDSQTESGFKVKKLIWDSIYQHHMDIIRPYVQKNANSLLTQVNNQLTKDTWDKYCLGSISKWEMDSIGCYIHEHELAHAHGLDIERYSNLPQTPQVDRLLPIKGKLIPIFKLSRIMGTVIDKDKAKKLVTLLTTDGVVIVKVYGTFQVYDKQISERGTDGKKHIIEKSTFSRGNKIVVTGMRDGDNMFTAKKYKNTPYHRIELIDTITEDGTIITRTRGDEE